MDVELGDDGGLKTVSWPETRCSTPMTDAKSAKEERGLTASLNKKTSVTTFDRISGTLKCKCLRVRVPVCVCVCVRVLALGV